jgi:hypothetical protein
MNTNTFNLVQVNEATAELIGHNAAYLINYIYAHKDRAPYSDPLTRVGLVLKTLLKSNRDMDIQTLSPPIEDLTVLINEAVDPALRRTYLDELKYLRSCALNDDLISLNTTH